MLRRGSCRQGTEALIAERLGAIQIHAIRNEGAIPRPQGDIITASRKTRFPYAEQARGCAKDQVSAGGHNLIITGVVA